MKMNEKLLAQAYADLEGDLGNSVGGVHSQNTVLIIDEYGDYWCFNRTYPTPTTNTYICTVEEFNNYSPEKHTFAGERLEGTIIQMESTQEIKSPCKTKQKLHTAKKTICGMEIFMEECGILEAWNDNKSDYLGEE